MSNNIKFPIAISTETDMLIHISEVSSGYDCYCFACKEKMVAVNKESNKVIPHFRHKPGSNCSVRLETYLHWLAKEVLSKHTDFIELPEINSKHLLEDESSKILKILFKKYKVPKELQRKFFYGHMLQPVTKIELKNHSLEETFNSSLGKIKVDFVIKDDIAPLFIEPFFTNTINDEKLRKIEQLDISTISINLCRFGGAKGYNFTLPKFINYISGPQGKAWIYLRKNKRQKLLTKYRNALEKDIANQTNTFKDFHKIRKEIDELKGSLDPLRNELSKIRNKIAIKNSELKSILDSVIK